MTELKFFRKALQDLFPSDRQHMSIREFNEKLSQRWRMPKEYSHTLLGDLTRLNMVRIERNRTQIIPIGLKNLPSTAKRKVVENAGTTPD